MLRAGEPPQSILSFARFYPLSSMIHFEVCDPEICKLGTVFFFLLKNPFDQELMTAN